MVLPFFSFSPMFEIDFKTSQPIRLKSIHSAGRRQTNVLVKVPTCLMDSVTFLISVLRKRKWSPPSHWSRSSSICNSRALDRLTRLSATAVARSWANISLCARSLVSSSRISNSMISFTCKRSLLFLLTLYLPLSEEIDKLWKQQLRCET